MSDWIDTVFEVHLLQDPTRNILHPFRRFYAFVVRNCFKDSSNIRFVIDGITHHYNDISVLPLYTYKGKCYLLEDPYIMLENTPGVQIVGIMVIPSFFYNALLEHWVYISKVIDLVPCNLINKRCIPVKYPSTGKKLIVPFSQAPDMVKKNYLRLYNIARGMVFAMKSHEK